jgi:8-oxo-dGTP pyrophosphatase MutT (NUDIX family)
MLPLHRSKILNERSKLLTNWLEFTEITYQDEAGQQRSWEAVHRRFRNEAAIIVAQLRPSGKYVLVRQFRPPTGGYVLEFPAGLVDSGETPAEAALRELSEETGYQGEAVRVSMPLYSSPGMLGETCRFVFVDIDENLPTNKIPQPHSEPGEFLDVYAVDPSEIPDLMKREEMKTSHVDIKLFAFFKDFFTFL